MKMRSITLLGFVMAATVASVALADGKDDKDERRGPAFLHPPPSGAAAHASAAAASASAATSASAAGGTAASNDEDEGSGADEKPENRDKRRAYIRRMKAKLAETLHAGGKTITDEERDVVRTHWRHTMRLWRIRHLAMLDGDKGIVLRVDALLAKEDDKTTVKLKELNDKAPKSTAPAASAAPSATAATGGAK